MASLNKSRKSVKPYKGISGLISPFPASTGNDLRERRSISATLSTEEGYEQLPSREIKQDKNYTIHFLVLSKIVYKHDHFNFCIIPRFEA